VWEPVHLLTNVGVFSWQGMVLPDLVCDYKNSSVIRTYTELFIRIILTLGFIYGMNG
jgi:hypothetical protein